MTAIAPPPETATLAQFARVMGVGRSYITKLKQHGRLVLSDDGKRVLVEASKQRIKDTGGAHKATDPEDGDETTPQTRAYWEKREAAAKAELREIELAERRRELLPVTDIESAAADLGARLRAALENLPDQIAPALAAEHNEDRVRQMLIDHIDNVLSEIADLLKAITAPGGKGGG